jgi:hypothetical protein
LKNLKEHLIARVNHVIQKAMKSRFLILVCIFTLSCSLNKPIEGELSGIIKAIEIHYGRNVYSCQHNHIEFLLELNNLSLDTVIIEVEKIVDLCSIKPNQMSSSRSVYCDTVEYLFNNEYSTINLVPPNSSFEFRLISNSELKGEYMIDLYSNIEYRIVNEFSILINDLKFSKSDSLKVYFVFEGKKLNINDSLVIKYFKGVNYEEIEQTRKILQSEKENELDMEAEF